jgi:hypothetical protein
VGRFWSGTTKTTLAVCAVLGALAIPVAPSGAQPRARIACTRDVPAVIGGRHKCLGAGEYCATRYERQYERYGFECSSRYDPPRLRRR